LISKTLVKVSDNYFNAFIETQKAVVGNARNCTTCRECVRHEKFADVVDIGKIKDAFEFHVESVGIYKPERLVFEALEILK
jgi:DNA-directed RNA polymerase I and III subunit RPAC1